MKFLLCTEGAADAAAERQFAANLARISNASLILLAIVPPGSGVQAATNLDRNRTFLAEQGIEVETVVREGEPTREIVAYTDAVHDVDLVVLGSRRKAGAGRYWRSARVYKLLRMLSLPALVVIGRRDKLNRILICTGGRDFISHALEVTARLALAADAEVTLFHIIASPPGMYARLQAMQETTEQIMTSETDLGRHLRDQETRLKKAGVRVRTRVRQGAVLAQLAEEMREADYDMVVTGTSVAGSRLRGYIMGDVTREIINRVGCPVLVVPPT